MFPISRYFPLFEKSNYISREFFFFPHLIHSKNCQMKETLTLICNKFISSMQNETSLFYFKFYILFPVQENFVIITIICYSLQRESIGLNRI